jgi:peptidoglycan/xylan/chitin deacetylase (PgdA/CDA1 family)
MVIVFLTTPLIILGIVIRWYGYIAPPVKGLPVLMYHKVDMSRKDNLTISIEQFESHLKFLKENKYEPISMNQLIHFLEKKSLLPDKPVLITFDDGYLNNLELAYPLLQKYHFKAVIFIATSFIGTEILQDGYPTLYMSIEQLKTLEPSLIEFGLHSHLHNSYSAMNVQEIEKDLDICLDIFNTHQIPFVPALAYPYGARPKEEIILKQMKELFKRKGIKVAFRIGNKINSFSPDDLYELKRIDITGNDSFRAFKAKLKKGRIKLF